MIKVAPGYPENCRAKAVEGTVIVQFDVTDRGDVTNVQIISSDNSCFDRTVIKTVLGWKYPPRAQYGLVERFVFELKE
jgi:protein TonB